MLANFFSTVKHGSLVDRHFDGRGAIRGWMVSPAIFVTILPGTHFSLIQTHICQGWKRRCWLNLFSTRDLPCHVGLAKIQPTPPKKCLSLSLLFCLRWEKRFENSLFIFTLRPETCPMILKLFKIFLAFLFGDMQNMEMSEILSVKEWKCNLFLARLAWRTNTRLLTYLLAMLWERLCHSLIQIRKFCLGPIIEKGSFLWISAIICLEVCLFCSCLIFFLHFVLMTFWT